MDDFVRTMHTKSGLLTEIAASTLSLEEAGDATLAFIRTHVPKARTVPLAGNSIGTDRRFLAAQLPAIEEYLHYRSVDVSTVKELGRRWFPDLMKAGPHQGRRAPGHGRHPRERGRAGLLPHPPVPRGRRLVPLARWNGTGVMAPLGRCPHPHLHAEAAGPATPERSTDGPAVRSVR